MIQQGIDNQMNQGVNTGQVNTIGQLNKDRTELNKDRPKTETKTHFSTVSKNTNDLSSWQP